MSDNSEAFEESKSEMLEDEEMPTFISVSSKDISLPYTDGNIQLLAIDNSANNRLPLRTNVEENRDDYEAQSRSPTTEEREEEVNDENEDGSVYVLSSGDDADDADDPSSRSYDEDIDDEEDVDDEEDDDIDDMDEIDAEEDEVGVTEDGQLLGDFSEDEIEKEDTMSDDMALRSDKPLAISDSKRSQSLQNLSEYRSPPRRKTFITGGNKYNCVQSKVRRYIQDLKERNRTSAENRLKIIQDNKKSEELENEVIEQKEAEKYLQKSRRSIKDYAEQALKDLEMREENNQVGDDDALTEEADDNIVRPNDHSHDHANLKTKNQENRRNDFNSGFKTALDIYKSRKVNMNGEVGNNPLKGIKIPKEITVNYNLNGQTQGQNILDVRSIGYDEYMRGSSNSSADKIVESIVSGKKLSPSETQPAQLEITDIRSEKQIISEIQSVQNTSETPMEVVDAQEDTEVIVQQETNDGMNKEALAELAIIQSQLNQKTTQCKEIREAYEKTLSENFQLKQELEDLKKTIATLTAKKPAPQVVAVAIQTDLPLPPPQSSDETKDTLVSDNCMNPKLSTSSMGSAFSANEHWTESAGSLPSSNGSVRPLPNLTPLSNAEDSFIGVPNTPLRTPRQPSHAFQTSSRIIKMLSSITQRKPKCDGSLNGDESSPNIFGKGFSSSPCPGISSYNSPVNHHRGSKKRKASDIPENANFLQPPKIPHTSGGSHRLHRRTRTDFKHPGDFVKPNSPAFPPQSSSDANKTLENSENSQRENDAGEDLDSGVKCFTYRDDESSSERSFLIQAEDEAKSQESGKGGDRSSLGVVRECGPYLLGNVEVRMTEINGTINIWGKEVSQETTVEDEPEEDVDIEDDIIERGACSCCYKTPSARLSSGGPISCSTNKKLNVPPLRLNESAYSKSYHSPSTSTLDHFKGRQNIRNPDNNKYCRICDSHSNNSRILNKIRRLSKFGDEDHSNNFNCGCNWDNENCDNALCGRVSRHCHSDHACASSSETLNVRGLGRCSRLNSVTGNTQSKTEEHLDRNQSLRLSNNFDDEHFSCHHGVRNNCGHLEDDIFKRPSTPNARAMDGFCKNGSCRTQSPSLNNQSNDPLLSHHSHEPPEARRRRSSGKRVRGILMDFLKGCGDCRNPNGSDNKISPSIIPQIRIGSGTPPPALTSQTQPRPTEHGSTNKKCVHMECCATCSKRIEMAAEIETQLEIFGAEMERLRSRSQAVLGMLNTLHSADTN